LLVDALQHRLGEVQKRRTPDADALRDGLVGELLVLAKAAVSSFDQNFSDMAALRRKSQKALASSLPKTTSSLMRSRV
jgi:hypothetical protein